MSGGGKGGGGQSYVVGYKYYMGIHVAICHGPVDRVNRIVIGEREAWSGAVSTSSTININNPMLFGGDAREGGVAGDVDIMMGEPTQPQNTYLAKFQGAKAPAYRGLLSLVFKSFFWSSGNPYFKSPWVEATRVLAGWQNNSPWNPGDAQIGLLDMNPAHIVYQCLTDQRWGMGYSPNDIDETSFTNAALALKTEDFGLSIHWTDQSSIEDFVKLILNHINGVLGLDLNTGKFVLKLIRGDYDIGSLLSLDESNVDEIKSFQRVVLGDAANEVIVMYTDRDGKSVPVSVQNIAAVNAQGGVISTTKNYPAIRTADLAARVALRDLATISSPLAKVTLTCNRAIWDKEEGDVVKLSWQALGLNAVPFRVLSIGKGSLTSSKITVSLVEDVFGLPTSSYTLPQQSQWVDTLTSPVAADAAIAVEAPYWEVVKNVTLADRDKLEPDYGFGMFLCSRGAVRSPLNYSLVGSSDNINYGDIGTGHFNPSGLLAAGINKTQTAISLSGAYDLQSVVLSADGGYAYLGNECVSVISVNVDSGAVVIGRGVLDTVPSPHAIGTRIFFVTPGAVYDRYERTAGETVYYRALPSTGIGTLDLADAPTEVLTFGNRASRPYPPAGLKVSGADYPSNIAGPGISLSWSHRDRAAQTVTMIDQTVGNIGPEPGVSYRIRVRFGATLLATYDIAGNKTSWTYPTPDDIAHGNRLALNFEVVSVLNGLESMYALSHTVNRSVATGGVFVDGPPAKPTLNGTPGTFAVDLAWVFGDGRTNIEKVELRVSTTPIFDEGSTLQYVNYPTQSYTHEIGEVGAHRWYWVRVIDLSGQLSPWSDVAYARAGFVAGVTTVTSLPAVPTAGGEVVRLAADGKLYVWSGTTWMTGVAAGDIIGNIDGTQLVAGSVGSAALAANAITETNITNDAISSPKIQAGAITAAKIAALSITADKIAASTIGADKIAANTITADKIASGTITGDRIAANTLSADKIIGGTITADKMSVSQLSSISANLGAITGGSLDIAGKFIVNNTGQLTVKSAVSGQRMEVTNSAIKVIDSGGVTRVKIGDLSA